MKNIIIRRLISIFVCLLLLLSMVGCDTNGEGYKSFKSLAKYKDLNDEIVASNLGYDLIWNDQAKLITLFDKANNVYWGNDGKYIPTERAHPQVISPIYITYFDNQTYSTKTAYAQTSSIKKDAVSAEKLKNGISVRYDFESEKISVTVDFELRKDSLLVSVDKSKITETPEKRVTEIAILPFFTSAKNQSENSYLFVPSGQGAIMYPNVTSDTVSNISEKVYGTDYSVSEDYKFTNTQAVNLPVYGVKNGNAGLCAIIENDAEAANINTISNSQNMGYTTVYASFLTRGYDNIDMPDGFGSGGRTKLFSAAVDDTVASVAFYPFAGENSSYIDMANIYRNYLLEKYDAKPTNKNEIPLNLNIIGGAMKRELFVGVPYNDLYVMTSIEDATEIIKNTNKLLNDNFNVTLSGFGESGLDYGKIAGNGKISNKFGSESEINSLFNFCRDNKLLAYVDFNTVFFSKNGFGVSASSNSIVGVNGKRIGLTYKSLQTGFSIQDGGIYRALGRGKLNVVHDKLLANVIENEYSGVLLSTLTNANYSDYSEKQYFVSGKMEKQVTEIIKEYKDKNVPVMGSTANGYAAILCDSITNVPLDSSQYNVYSESVPFYQIVFKGYVPMTTKPLNYYSDSKTALLRAIESGSGISLSVADNYNIDFISSIHDINQILVNGEIDKYLKDIVDNGYFEVFAATKNSKIVGHTVVGNCRKTEFDNGTIIYVNYGDTPCTIDEILVEANSFSFKEEEG